MELKHYGVKGMKWGVRKGRNRSAVNDIFRTMTPQERKFLVGNERARVYATKDMYGSKSTNVASFVRYYNNKPVSFFDVYENAPGVGEVAVGSRADSRGKGHAKITAQRAIDYIRKQRQLTTLEWKPDSNNTSSIALAKSLGFVVESESNGITKLVYKL